MADTVKRSPGDIAELIALERRRVESLLPCDVTSCRSNAAHERTLMLLCRELTKLVPPKDAPAHTAFESARRAADVLRFEVPRSHRRNPTGVLITAAKKGAVEALQPFHTELLRPQHRFNVEAIEVMKLLWSRRISRVREDSSALVTRRLGPLCAPHEWSMRSHREGSAARLVRTAKTAYLRSILPIVQPVLERQRRWNEEIVAAMTSCASLTPPAGRAAEELVRELAQLADTASSCESALPSTDLLWIEVFRRQQAFNRELTLAIAELLGTRLPPGPPPEVNYAQWISSVESLPEPTRTGATVAIVPLGLEWSAEAVAQLVKSVRSQTGVDCWLVSPDDDAVVTRLSRAFRRGHRDVSVRTGTEGAEFVLVVGPEVHLRPKALSLMVSAAADADVVYSDEDVLREGERTRPFFKPDWSPDLLRTFNYFGPCTLIRSERFSAADTLYATVLGAVEGGARVAHVPHVLFHRTGDFPADVVTGEEQAALEASLRRSGTAATVERGRAGLRVRYDCPHEPLVSIIVPFRDRPDLLERLYTTLIQRTAYQNFELLLVSNQSTQPETFALLARCDDPRVRKLSWDEPFNYSSINNHAVRQARGELLLFLNNDIEIVEPEWLGELVSHAMRPAVGSVGAKLCFPDGSLQHAGAVVGLSGFAGHPFWRMTHHGHFTPWGRADWVRNVLAVTAACVMVRRAEFDAVGGFDERFKVVGGDIDLGIRLQARGLWNVYTPHARLIHHESASRREDQLPVGDLWNSFLSYRPFLQRGDPFYNPNLTVLRPDASLRMTGDDDAETLAVRTLAGTLPGTEEEWTSLARAEAQRHLADHLPGYDAPQRAAPSSTLPLRTVEWLVSRKTPCVDQVIALANAFDECGGTRSEILVLGTGVENQRTRDPHPFVRFVTTRAELESRPAPDLVVATDWRAAFAAASRSGDGLRAYWVRELESLSHAAGTEFGLVETAFRLGLYGIFHGEGLATYLRQNYGMDGCVISHPVDKHLFRPAPAKTQRHRVRGFLQADPAIAGEPFELLVAAAVRAHRELGVEFVTAGTSWNPIDFRASEAVVHYGALPAAELADLYRTCDFGLALSFLRTPSRAQLELLASGVPLITNPDPGASWLVRDGHNALIADPTTTCLVETIRRMAGDSALRSRLAAQAAAEVAPLDWRTEAARVLRSLQRAARVRG